MQKPGYTAGGVQVVALLSFQKQKQSADFKWG